MRRWMAVALLALGMTVGCSHWRSNGVNVTTVNDSSQKISNIEVDYTGGSYGIEYLDPGKSHTRWVKFTGDSQLQYSYFDAGQKSHSFRQGSFNAQSKGTATVHIGADGAVQFQQDFSK